MAALWQVSTSHRYELWANSAKGWAQWTRCSCPVSSEHKAHRYRIGPLHHFVEHDDRSEQIVWGYGVAIHQAVIRRFEMEGFTGFRTKPASVTFADGITSSEYCEFIVTGWAGTASPGAGAHLVESCSGCHWKRYSAITDFDNVIDPRQWTGEDFFIAWPFATGYLFCSDRVARWLRVSSIKSFSIERPFEKERQRPWVMDGGFPRGSISEYLPDDLAIKYGRPLGLE